MVAFEVERERFEAANAQVLGISVDHVYSHAAWAEANGGFNYPLLADFNPHGEVTRRYGLWRAERGNGKRAIIIVDRGGIVRWVKVYERGIPENDEVLAALAELS